VERPWRSRFEERDDHGTRISVSVTSPDHYEISSADRVLDLGPPRPGPPSGDYHLDAVLPDLLHRHLAVRLGPRTVAGQACVDYRTGGPLGDAFSAPTADEHADLCVTDDGILLREDWWRNGGSLRSTVATSLERGPVDSSLFTVPDAQPVDSTFVPDRVQPFSIRQLPHDTARFWLAAHPPWHLQLTRRYRAQANLSGAGSGAVTTLDVYQHGDVAVVVSQQPAGAAPTDGVAVDVPGLGTARSTLRPEGAQLHVVSHGVDLVLRGPMTSAQLEWFARSLRPVRAT